MRQRGGSLILILLFCVAATPEHDLPEPLREHGLITLDPAVGTVFAENTSVWVLPPRATWGARMPIPPKGVVPASLSGRLPDVPRLPIYEASVAGHEWSGMTRASDKVLLLLDGINFSLFEVDGENLKELMRRSVAWDLVRPPRDRGGEATTPETREFRADFKRALQSIKGIKIAGMARVPTSWGLAESKSEVFALATRAARFPLLLMECDREEYSSCHVTRACHVDHPPPPDAITGLAIGNQPKTFLIGDRKARRLGTYRFKTCENSQLASWHNLPVSLRELSAFAVADDGALWLGTRAKDDRLDASVYVWPKGDW